MSEVSYDNCIDPGDLTVFKDESNNLAVEVEGRGSWSKVAVRLAFPYSDPDHYIALIHEGEQIGMVRDLEELDPDSRAVLQEVLSRRYHIPEVLRVLHVREDKNATVWTVETDRGQRHLMVRDRHNFRRIGGGDTIIVDVDGNRFRLRRDRRFDEESQQLLDTYI
jgi:hypothetical protein